MHKIDRQKLYIILIVLIGLTAFVSWWLFRDVLREMLILVQNGNEQELSAFLASQSGFTGYVALYLVSILQVVSIVLPGVVFQIAGALIFGWLPSFLICWAGFVSGNAIVFFVARFFGRQLMDAVGLEPKDGWLVEKMNSADPRFVTALACLVPGVPNGIIPYVAQRADMRLYSFVIAIAVSSWPIILLNCLAGHFLMQGEFMYTALAFGLQILILIVVAMNRDRIMNFGKNKAETEATEETVSES
ncbi:MAG: VTT domain-containing protein [Erysipelotrichaceae bacterium]|nr:VTT domain-containing protein [Erysipelotrichaceae bacterium]